MELVFRESVIFLVFIVNFIESYSGLFNNQDFSCSNSPDSLAVEYQEKAVALYMKFVQSPKNDWSRESSPHYDEYINYWDKKYVNGFDLASLDTSLHLINKAIKRDSNFCAALDMKLNVLILYGLFEDTKRQVIELSKKLWKLNNNPIYLLRAAVWIELSGSGNKMKNYYKTAKGQFKELSSDEQEFPIYTYYYAILCYLTNENEKALNILHEIKGNNTLSDIINRNIDQIKGNNRKRLLDDIYSITSI